MSPRALAPLAALLLASTASAQDAGPVFNRVASFPVTDNKPEGADMAATSSSEIIAASDDGMMIVYSDSPAGGIGFIDIADPAAPASGGFVAFEGEPTAVAFAGPKVLVGVNTTEDLTAPSGNLAVVDAASKAIEASCDLGGQPDSVAVSPDGSFAAVAIENQRDEEVNDGAIPQEPAGFLVVLPLTDGVPDCEGLRRVDLAGLADIAPEDPEPEFVDINENGEIAVTLQENNHIAIVDGASGEVVADFSAGTVALEGVDVEDDGRLDFSGSIEARPREPDAIQWLGTDRLAIANEGDWNGGTRGFTILSREGEELYESGPSFEMEVARLGHYPDGRSDAKGVEPEGMEVAEFGEERLIFVLAERASVVGVYRDAEGADPELLQILPSGISPEGAIAIPERNLLVTANEADLGEDGAARSHVMIFERGEGPAAYPQIVSGDEEGGRPIGWGALSGLSASAEGGDTLVAVSDSVYSSAPTIFAIDAGATPARITAALEVTRDGEPAESLDLEGIVADGEGGFWLANEGNADGDVPHSIVRVDGEGGIVEEIPFPAELLEGATGSGAEGITLLEGTLWIAIQRPWGNDPENRTKLVSYDPEAGTWGAVLYPLETPSTENSWVGLSEITAHGDHLYLIERDNLIGEAAALKQITRVPVADLQAAPLGGDLPEVTKEVVRDLLPDLAAQTNGYVVDKVEGFAVTEGGTAFVVTDNDGVDDSSGETLFFRVDLESAQ